MTNTKVQISNEIKSSRDQKRYDLEERTAKFGENMIDFCQELIKNPINLTLVNQVVRSATSVGANYMEADGAESKKDFYHKIGICKKEAKETKHWLRMLAKANPNKAENCRIVWKEAQELTLIFSAISNSKIKSISH